MGEGPPGPRDAPADEAVRLRALDPRLSIVLQAPAGSGKTTVLTQRFLRLLCQVQQPEQILAITFTRKAAAEMRERIVRALRAEQAHRMPPGDDWGASARERSRALGWELESNPGRLRIQTIDSLNRVLASQLPLSARAAGDLAVLEQPLELYRSAARRTLLDADREPQLQDDLEQLLERLDADQGRAERLLIDMLRARAHWLPLLLAPAPGSPEGPASQQAAAQELTARVATSLSTLVRARLSAAAQRLPHALMAEGVALAQAAARQRQLAGDAGGGAWRCWAGHQAGSVLALEHWQGLAELALTGQGSWRKSFTRREGFAPHAPELKERVLAWSDALRRIEGAQELLLELAALPPPALTAEDAAGLAALARLLRLAASELEVVFQESARVDYTYVAAAARRALTEESAPTDLALRLGHELRHLLVDEFQDTSLEQYALIEALTAGWEEGDGRTLFLVGDPMQSIYQFREAEVGLFLRTCTHGLGRLALTPLALTHNFRAATPLIEWSNRIFARCFPQLDDARSSAVRFRPSIPASAAPASGCVRLHALPDADALTEARAIASLIAELRRQDPAASTAVLLGARAHAAPIVQALQGARIAVTGVDLMPLGDLPVVRDLAALTRALDHLGDRTAWVAALRAPWCGLTLAELTCLIEPDTHATLWELLSARRGWDRLEARSRTRLARTCTVLEDALGARARAPLATWVERTWLRLGGPAACRSEQDLVHADAFLTRLARWSSEPDWTGPLSLEERLRDEYAAEPACAGAVQLMTIHRAKGLEFDHVIVPGLGRKPRANSEPLLRWIELPRDREGSELLMAPIAPAWRRGSEPLGSYVKSVQARRAAHERTRLLYVAATRARLQLHLFGEMPLGEPGVAERPAAGSLLAALWPALTARLTVPIACAAPPAGASPASPAGPSSLRERLSAEWRLPAGSASVPFAGIVAETSEPALEALDLQGLETPVVAAEQSVCEYLRGCLRRGRLPEANDARASALLREGLERFGLAGAALDEALAGASRMLTASLADERLRWMLSAGQSRAESGVMLSGHYGGRLVHERLERTFVDTAAVRWILELQPLGAGSRSPAGTAASPAAVARRGRRRHTTAAASPQLSLLAPLERAGLADQRGAEPAAIAAAMQLLAPRLERRRALARALGPEPVRVAVFFPRLQSWYSDPTPPAHAQSAAKTNS
ncbi:MAG TPA: UvrD-helicase domain-containing protein [Steroidobacteraceae bacterium]|nr:UvrD-helicase domain-containing protein [Steroidobacteraceae bacterium]